MLGISGQEFLVILFVAAVVLGPERLPQYTQALAQMVRKFRRMAMGASEQARAELGPEFDDIDWRKLDPRQYDPRRIVREALADGFDPDDPLGMKDVQRQARETLDETKRQATEAVSGASDAVRVRRESPAEGPRSQNGGTSADGASRNGGPGSASKSAEPSSRFDPDLL